MEWRPIEEAEKFSGPIYVWVNGEIVEATWSRQNKQDEFAWSTSWDDGYSFYYLPIVPQPRFYLEVTPPPEEE